MKDALAEEKPAKTRAKAAGKPAKAPKASKAAKTTGDKAIDPRGKRGTGNSKKDQAARMLLRKEGMTDQDFADFGWSKSSVTMFIMWATIISRAGIRSVTVEKNAAGEKVYKAVA